MEKYLLIEDKIIQSSNFLFKEPDKTEIEFFSLKNNKIDQHRHLINAMLLFPEYIIFKRQESREKVIVLYYDKEAELTPYIPFNNWRLYDNIPQFKRNKDFNLEDPYGIRKVVQLTEYIPYLPKYLGAYINCRSFEEYEKLNIK